MTDLTRYTLRCDKCGVQAIGEPRSSGPGGWVYLSGGILGLIDGTKYLPERHLCTACAPPYLALFGYTAVSS